MIYCTLTGADDSTAIDDLYRLSAEFPFVEWGVLYSETQQGLGRYPSFKWLDALTDRLADDRSAHFSLHICGRAVHEFLMGMGEITRRALYFSRVQINFNATALDPSLVIGAIQRNADKNIITQDNDANYCLRSTLAGLLNHMVLFDASCGRGLARKDWPAPLPNTTCGYAGGLGPDNLSVQLPRIHAAAGGAPYWIDMEGKLRSELDRFDLTQARRCLGIAGQFQAAHVTT